MFQTYEEAEEINSDCAFCKKRKFAVVYSTAEGSPGTYDLERCGKGGCDRHCQWDHDSEAVKLEIDLGGPDVVSIASGWGASR